jgi:diketogulonate reductase-like aldo/keto reductase
MYGSSESVVGDLSTELKNRPSLFLATKVWTTGEQEGIEQMNDSFRKMKTSLIDLMQVHNLVDVKTHLKTLYKWKEQGRIRYIGITHYLPSAYDEMTQLIQKEKTGLCAMLLQYPNSRCRKTIITCCKRQGCGCAHQQAFPGRRTF